MARVYDNTSRSLAAARTAESIVDATEALLGGGSLADLTLATIAQRAGVTVQTVMRHMGSRAGCLEAVYRRVEHRVQEQRGGAAPGDVDGALDGLLLHYESEGRLVLNLLAQEHTGPEAQDAVEQGRSFHRAWVERCFGPLLEAGDTVGVDALVAATDLYVWRLLRLDLGRSPEATRNVIERLVRAALEPS